MITFFTVVRPFVGEFAQLQRLAIQSWLSAVPGCQVVVIGDREGAAEACAELGVEHAPLVAVNAQGTELVNDVFRVGEERARHELLCEISADIVLGGDFLGALRAIAPVAQPFMIGQRWDVEPGTVDPARATLHPPCGIDYFVYRRGTLGEIPPFAVGRTVYDNWLVWAACERWGLLVIDATAAVTAVHVNHSHPEHGNKAAMLKSAEKHENTRLMWASGCPRPYGVNDAPWVLSAAGNIERRAACPA